jgi:hypothetical protein
MVKVIENALYGIPLGKQVARASNKDVNILSCHGHDLAIVRHDLHAGGISFFSQFPRCNLPGLSLHQIAA